MPLISRLAMSALAAVAAASAGADFRSDTVTKPSASMRAAMAEAEVGDDVFGDDPTVIALEARGAALLGKEAALFVPSGTMANLCALLSWCERGAEFLVGDRAHIFLYEQGGAAALGGISPRTVPTNDDGTLSLADIESRIRGDDVHYPPTRLVAVEDTHNMCGGLALPDGYLDEVGALCKRRGLLLHLDGARLWNAASKSGQTMAERAAAADSVSICLSKGMGAPIGSLVCGPAAFIKRCRRMRKSVGGGMRQVGCIAAAAMVALDESFDLLAADHVRAGVLGATLDSLAAVDYTPPAGATNMVIFSVVEGGPLTAQELVEKLGDAGVRALAIGGARVRMVLHRDVTDEGVERACKELVRLLG